MRRNILDIIIDIILFFLAILIIYWVIELIIGGSPELSQFNSAIIIMLIGLLFKVYREMGEIKTSNNYINKSVKESFALIKQDMSSIKKKLKI